MGEESWQAASSVGSWFVNRDRLRPSRAAKDAPILHCHLVTEIQNQFRELWLRNFPTPFLAWVLAWVLESARKLLPGFQRAHNPILLTLTLFLMSSSTSPSHIMVHFLMQRKSHSAKFQSDSTMLFYSQGRLGGHRVGQQSWARRHPLLLLSSKVTVCMQQCTLGMDREREGWRCHLGHGQQDTTSRLGCLENGLVGTSLRHQVAFTVRRSAGVLLLSPRNIRLPGTCCAPWDGGAHRLFCRPLRIPFLG